MKKIIIELPEDISFIEAYDYIQDALEEEKNSSFECSYYFLHKKQNEEVFEAMLYRAKKINAIKRAFENCKFRVED